MDFHKLYEDMNANTPLNRECSLPVVVEKDGEKHIIWFQFTILEKEGKPYISVKKIGDTIDGENFDYENVKMVQELDYSENEENKPQITTEEYLTGVESIFLDFDKKDMIILLLKASHGVLHAIYEWFISYYINKKSNDSFLNPQVSNTGGAQESEIIANAVKKDFF